jgi:hypothetical protein
MNLLLLLLHMIFIKEPILLKIEIFLSLILLVTFYVSFITLKDGKFEIKATAEETLFGGEDFNTPSVSK